MLSDRRFNVVLFVAEHWRAKDAGYCGNRVVKTPNIDSLAREGAGFRWCFVQNPVSTPSRVAMATGWYPHVNGHRTMHHMLRLYEPNMLWYLKEASYYVWWGGKNDMIAEEAIPYSCDVRVYGTGGRRTVHASPWKPGDRLYHTFLWGRVPDNYRPCVVDDYVVEKAVEFLRNPVKKPFFMLINQSYAHPPYAAPEPYYSMYDHSEVPLPVKPPDGFKGKPRILKMVHERMRMNEATEEDLREIVAVYYGMITRVDHNLGLILEALKDYGHWDDTIVVATSDHGDYAGDYMLTEKMQNAFEDVLVNVPFAIRIPDYDPLPSISEALVEMIDLLPTLADACGVKLAHTHFGRSLLPVLRGERKEHRRYVFSEGGALKTEIHTHETDRPRENIYWARVALQFSMPEIHGKAVMIRSKEWKYVRRLYDTDELYDLKRDPNEVNNLADDPDLEDVCRRLADAMLTWFIETGDQVPWRWDLRRPNEPHPEWSRFAAKYGFSRTCRGG